MKIIIDTPEKLYKLAAENYVSLLSEKPRAVLGFATGSSPVGIYDELSALYREGKISFEEAVTFNLDEYVGLDTDDSQSYRYFMFKNLFDRIDIPASSVNFPSYSDTDPDRTAQYDKNIANAGGIDLQLLGIGVNGHIGFNEPGTAFASVTHKVKLTDSTRKANSRFFAGIDDVPEYAVSMGIKTVMNAKKIILIACGAIKAEAIAKAVKGEVTPDMPASVLQLHPDVTLYLDRDAASLL